MAGPITDMTPARYLGFWILVFVTSGALWVWGVDRVVTVLLDIKQILEGLRK